MMSAPSGFAMIALVCFLCAVLFAEYHVYDICAFYGYFFTGLMLLWNLVEGYLQGNHFKVYLNLAIIIFWLIGVCRLYHRYLAEENRPGGPDKLQLRK